MQCDSMKNKYVVIVLYDIATARGKYNIGLESLHGNSGDSKVNEYSIYIYCRSGKIDAAICISSSLLDSSASFPPMSLMAALAQ